MKEFLELKKVVESKEFQQKKYNWVHTKYKSTSIYETISQYKKMLHDKELQLYLELENSQRLKDYLEFRQSPNYVKLQSKKEVRNSLELKQWAEFEKSADFKAYIRYRSSKTPERFRALVAEVSTPEYKQQHAFWSNPKRWKTTDEYQQEVRYKQLAAMADIQYFFKEDRKPSRMSSNGSVCRSRHGSPVLRTTIRSSRPSTRSLTSNRLITVART